MEKQKEKKGNANPVNDKGELEFLSFDMCNMRLEALCRKIKTQKVTPRKLEYNS